MYLSQTENIQNKKPTAQKIPPLQTSFFLILGLPGKIRRNRRKMRKTPYRLTLKSLTCQGNYGGIAENCALLRTNSLSSLWLIRKITEESQNTKHISVPACFQVFGFSEALRRNRRKLRRPPYQSAFKPLAGRKRYGEIAENCAFLRTSLLSSLWLVRSATEESHKSAHSSVHKSVPAKSFRLFSILKARQAQEIKSGRRRGSGF